MQIGTGQNAIGDVTLFKSVTSPIALALYKLYKNVIFRRKMNIVLIQVIHMEFLKKGG